MSVHKMKFITFLIFGMTTVLCQQVVLDLSHGYDDQTFVPPGHQPFVYLTQKAGLTQNDVWYAANNFASAEHCGTHLDAPYHFNKNGRKVGEIPLTKLLTRACFVNATEDTAGNSQYKLPASKLVEWETEYGPMANNCVLLVSFGWSAKYPNKTEYFGPSDNDLQFPGLSAEAAQWVVDNKKIVGVGVDTPSVDQGNNREAHVILNNNDIYILENVNMNFDFQAVGFDIIVLPMKLMNGTGAPCRVVVLI